MGNKLTTLDVIKNRRHPENMRISVMNSQWRRDVMRQGLEIVASYFVPDQLMAENPEAVQSLRNLELSEYQFPNPAIVKCSHCGQWAARQAPCKHCGAPV